MNSSSCREAGRHEQSGVRDSTPCILIDVDRMSSVVRESGPRVAICATRALRRVRRRSQRDGFAGSSGECVSGQWKRLPQLARGGTRRVSFVEPVVVLRLACAPCPACPRSRPRPCATVKRLGTRRPRRPQVSTTSWSWPPVFSLILPTFDSWTRSLIRAWRDICPWSYTETYPKVIDSRTGPSPYFRHRQTLTVVDPDHGHGRRSQVA